MSEQTGKFADACETFLTALAVADTGLGPNDDVEMLGSEGSTEAVLSEMSRLRVVVGDFDSRILMPHSTHVLYAPSRKEDLFTLVTTEKLGFVASQRVRRFTSQAPRADCKAIVANVRPSGEVQKDKPVMFYKVARCGWLPVDPACRRVKMDHASWRRGRHVDGQVESLLPPYPELAAMACFAKQSCWQIALSLPGSPFLNLNTDPIGVRELLRMREVPDGMTRRQALVHWVKEHWRKNRTDPSVDHRVREHLRGSRLCDWFGLTVRISPSQTDEITNKLLSAGVKLSKRM